MRKCSVKSPYGLTLIALWTHSIITMETLNQNDAQDALQSLTYNL